MAGWLAGRNAPSGLLTGVHSKNALAGWLADWLAGWLAETHNWQPGGNAPAD